MLIPTALPHYEPERGADQNIDREAVFLEDSGTQYEGESAVRSMHEGSLDQTGPSIPLERYTLAIPRPTRSNGHTRGFFSVT